MNAQLATPMPARSFEVPAEAPAVRRVEPKFSAPENGNSLLDAFLALGAGVDERTAHARTLAWYRSSGAAWTGTLG